ncbi:MAG: LuxR C-terminal-related transcriptional regulator [Poseidonibacter sp.]|uniref:response regulator transcription factor n=1 Tax=Poseidonibacter sp. TaxID=2321188 RepID=UPI00359DBCF4
MKTIYLLSDDLLLLERWKKLINIETKVIDDTEELRTIKDSILIVNTSVCKNISSKFINDFIKDQNQIIVLDNTPSFLNAKRFLDLGVKGYGNTLMTTSYLNSAIEAVSNNYVWLIPQVTTQFLKDITKEDTATNEKELFENLTKTEKTIASLLKDGYKNTNISEELDISINTVKTHIKHIYEKLNVKDRLSFAGLFSK